MTPYEMINEKPRLKTEPYIHILYVLSVLFVSEIYIEKKNYQMVILQSINAGFRTAILVFTWFKLEY